MGSSTGLILVNEISSLSKFSCRRMLFEACQKIKNNIYVVFGFSVHDVPQSVQITACNFIAQCYSCSQQLKPDVNVTVYLSHLKSSERFTLDSFHHKPDIVFSDTDVPLFDKDRLIVFSDLAVSNGSMSNSSAPSLDSLFVNEKGVTSFGGIAMYDGVVLGGTFDRLHSGHKILLSASGLLAKRKLTIGVTDGPMLKNKVLRELIEPIDVRIDAVRSFLQEIDSSLELKIVPIRDPFGPSIVDTDLQCAVASQETARGAHKINEERLKKGLSQLDVQLIGIIEDETENEGKISSSGARKSLLGVRLREPIITRTRKPDDPYVIGLTGGVASGKSNMSKYVETLGAFIIDCDKLGHLAYVKGTQCYDDMVTAFGEGIVAPDSGEIDRKQLGPIVFASDEAMNKLNSLVWPAIARLAEEKIAEAKQNKRPVVVVDAAILLEAKWDYFCDEIWVAIIPREVAIERLGTRNNLSVDKAIERIESQMSNEERVKRANVVFCSQWDYSETQRQLKRAWDRLLHEGLATFQRSRF